MPGCVQNLLTEIQAVDADLVFTPLAAHTHLARLEDGSGFAVFPGCLQRDVTLGVTIEHAEEVVVGSGHQDTVREKCIDLQR